ncbi:MAG: hypothetical protein QXR76_06470 [Candidatus Bathyarchaeia archaeon]
MMKKALALKLEEEEMEFSEKLAMETNSVGGFKLLFLNGDKSIHQVEVRKINFQDLMRHLQKGESVLITPKLKEDFLAIKKTREEQAPWYFAHL